MWGSNHYALPNWRLDTTLAVRVGEFSFQPLLTQRQTLFAAALSRSDAALLGLVLAEYFIYSVPFISGRHSLIRQLGTRPMGDSHAHTGLSLPIYGQIISVLSSIKKGMDFSLLNIFEYLYKQQLLHSFISSHLCLFPQTEYKENIGVGICSTKYSNSSNHFMVNLVITVNPLTP